MRSQLTQKKKIPRSRKIKAPASTPTNEQIQTLDLYVDCPRRGEMSITLIKSTFHCDIQIQSASIMIQSGVGLKRLRDKEVLDLFSTLFSLIGVGFKLRLTLNLQNKSMMFPQWLRW